MRSLIVEREPVYRQGETVQEFAAGCFGLAAGQLAHVGDDRIGRALDRLFDADRAALWTEVVVAVGQRFGVCFDQLHNDSTSVAFCGQCRQAAGRRLRSRTAPAIVHGYSKDHRPDLKQLLFILSVAADGGVPVQLRVADGNTSDSVTHIQTWDALRSLTGRADFLYVADSKLCSRDNMEHIHRAGGRFVTVMPRSRQEDAEFRNWLQTPSSRAAMASDTGTNVAASSIESSPAAMAIRNTTVTLRWGLRIIGACAQRRAQPHPRRHRSCRAGHAADAPWRTDAGHRTRTPGRAGRARHKRRRASGDFGDESTSVPFFDEARVPVLSIEVPNPEARGLAPEQFWASHDSPDGYRSSWCR